MLHIYCGDGKGKTTAAIGLAVRFAGAGGQAVIARFLKNDASGEVAALRAVPGITVLPSERTFGFTWEMTAAEKAEAAAYYRELLEKAAKLAGSISGKPVLLVLDEANAAIRAGLLNLPEVLRVLDELPDQAEAVITGRDPAPELVERADYITEMRCVRHPYTRGIRARKGIEY